MSITGRRNLVVVRSGDASLHRQWVASPDRNFDLVVHYFGADPQRWSGDGDLFRHQRGPKFAVLADFFRDEADLLAGYDQVWLPDDDLEVDTDSISALFDLHAALGLGLSQPGLTESSYFSHAITLAVPGLGVRWTNFVEVMAPMFSRAALELCLPTFGLSQSGWGLDVVWSSLMARHGLDVAVLDGAPVRHTRPIGGGSLYATLARSPQEEYEELCAAYDVPLPYDHLTHRALTAAGSVLSAVDLASGLLAATPAAAKEPFHFDLYLRPTLTLLLTA